MLFVTVVAGVVVAVVAGASSVAGCFLLLWLLAFLSSVAGCFLL